jgi:hypothetical protein
MSQNNDEVLVRVEGVSKKFCRSLKKSLWYGVCDIASELNPFRGNVAEGARRSAQLSRDPTSRAEQIEDRVGNGTAGGNQRADSGEFLEGHSQAGLQMDSEKLASLRSANAPSGSGEHSVILKNVSINSDGAAGAKALDSSGSAKALDSRPWTLDASSHQWLRARVHEKALNFSSSNTNFKP